jgi:FAD dependent oxidoreductase
MKPDILVIGDSLGGVLAAHTAVQAGHRVVWAVQHAWWGGQLTSQAVPPDEHRHIECTGCSRSYRAFRDAMHGHYRAQRGFLDAGQMTEGCNPGDGWVSRLCVEPAVAHAYLRELLAPSLASGRLQVVHGLPEGARRAASRDGRRLQSVRIQGQDIEAAIFIDASETGALLPLAGLPYRLGKESRSEFNEPLAPEQADRLDQQPVTWVLALRRHAKPGPVVPQPAAYAFWRRHVVPHYGFAQFSDCMPGSQTGEVARLPLFAEGAVLDWWRYRRVVASHQWAGGRDEVSLVNWAQNDYALQPLLEGPVSEAEVGAAARELSLCWLHWLQTEAGHPELQPAPDITGTPDGLAQALYVRESRRIQGLETLTQNELSTGDLVPMQHEKSVGIAWYNLDIHPTVRSGHGLNAKSRPYVLPLGIFLSADCDNLLPACKNLSVTHLASASTRVHATEWLAGEVAAHIASQLLHLGLSPAQLHDDAAQVAALQARLHAAGIPTAWNPEELS